MTLGLPIWIGKSSRSALIVLSIFGLCANSNRLLAQSDQVSNSLLATENEVNNIATPSGRTLAISFFSDTHGVDFGPYAQQLIHTLSDSWNSSAIQGPGSPINKDGFTAIRISINMDGTLNAMRLDGSSGNVALERAALNSLKQVKALPSLPKSFTGPNLDLRVRYGVRAKVAKDS
ncbi:TonB family protein [Granulicella sp. dw_53]|uniref:TonB family protein n=1 Tax=Granulicella sp. dw_53 TaxID=2719792 RepID=UPI001BD4833E|nr:TonB family protein [Granulicella sp. dw_53]